MRILVTGATGFVGPHVLRACRAHGHTALALVRSEADAPDADATYRADLLDADALATAVRTSRPDAVIHLAGRVGIRADDEYGTLYRANVMGTGCLMAALAEQAPQARVLNVGSAAQYGPPTTEPVTEATTCWPASHYGLSKHAQEQVVRAYADQGQPVVYVRTFNLTGPGDPTRSLLGKVARGLAAHALGRADRPLQVGALSSVRDVLDVRDAAAAYVHLAEQGANGACYNVCSGTGVEMQTCVAYLLEAAGRPSDALTVMPSAHAAPNVSRIVGDATALRATGWQPQTPLKQSLADLLADWQHRLATTPNVT